MSAFNGSMGFLPGSQMGRRNTRQQQPYAQPLLPSSPEPAVKPARAATMLPSSGGGLPQGAVALTPGLRYNMTQDATAQARRGALRTAQQTGDYKTGAGALDALRAEFGVNDKGITPEEANARRTRMFADARYKNASTLTGNALQPITMAGADAGSQMKTALAETSHLYPGYFQERQNMADANARANEMNTANVGVANSNAGLTDMQRTWMDTMLPSAQNAAELQNESQRQQNEYYPNKQWREDELSAAQRAKTDAEADKIGAEAGRIAEKTDPKTLQEQKDRYSKIEQENTTLRKQVADLLSKLEQKVGVGKTDEKPQNDIEKALAEKAKADAAAAAGGAGNNPPQPGNVPPPAAPDQGNYAIGQERVHKPTGRIETWNGSAWIAREMPQVNRPLR